MAFEKKRRSMVVLELTALIDVFSMLIIFLIKGTVFATATLSIPSGLELPKSKSKESLEDAPKVFITQTVVNDDFIKVEKPYSFFRKGNNVGKIQYQAEIKAYLEQAKKKNKGKNDNLLSLLADKSTPYSVVYDVVNFYRQAGFESVLFIAKTEAE